MPDPPCSTSGTPVTSRSRARCSTFSRAYIRHLIMADEILGLRLTTLHNLHFLIHLAARIRASILDGTFAQVKDEFLAGYPVIDHEVRVKNKTARERHCRSLGGD